MNSTSLKHYLFSILKEKYFNFFLAWLLLVMMPFRDVVTKSLI